MAHPDPVAMALDHGLKLRDLMEKIEALEICRKKEESEGSSKGGGIKGDSIVNRIENLPSLMAQSGLTPALLFYMSKIEKKNEDAVWYVYRYLKGENAQGDPPRSLCNDFSGSEGAGYGVALSVIAATLSLLNKNLDISSECRGSGDSAVKCLARVLKRIRSEPGEESVLEQELQVYLQELKKVIKPLLGSER